VSEDVQVRAVEANESIVAVVFFREIERAKLVEIDFIATEDKSLRRGFAAKLIESLAQDFKEIWLELSSSNEAALLFYEKQGFQLQGNRKDYYGKGNHALNMHKTS